MSIRILSPSEKKVFNQIVPHPLQSWEWGEFRQKTGVEAIRLGLFDDKKLTAGWQITLHPLPKLPFKIGYVPKSLLPTPELFAFLNELGRKEKVIFFKFEPHVYQPAESQNETALETARKHLLSAGCVLGKPLFTKYSFMLDLTKSEEQLLTQCKQKTRYNVRLAQRKGVVVSKDDSSNAFEDYLHLTFEETTKRQGFYAHTRDYHRKMWETLHPIGMAHLLKASLKQETLATWIVFTFNNVLYYPYGASSSKDRQVMASNLMMWEVIKFGKEHHCITFDMWGSLGPNPNPNDPWMGFHRFKEGYEPTLMEFIGTYDYVIDPLKYQLYGFADFMRWKLLKFRTVLPI